MSKRYESYLNDPELLSNLFIKNYCKHITDKEKLNFIDRAIKKAHFAHRNQTRLSREPYFVHLFETAKFLANYKMGYITISAGFLHDIIEDQNVTYEELKQEFNEDLAFLVKSVTKINCFFTTLKKDQINSLNIKNIIIGMAKDIRVIIIKLADRMHNMRTLSYLPREKQIKIANETFYIFCPIAERLGIADISNEFYDLCFYYLNEKEYDRIKEKYDELISIDSNHIYNIIKKLKKYFKTKTKIDICKIEGRNKSLWSIWNKIKNKNKNIHELYDLTAIRIIVKNKIQCYEVLGYLHEWFYPINNRFKDYIANPKPNLYQSLHTTLVIDSVITEVQIRSIAMEEYANRGIVAHWIYKEQKHHGQLSKDQYKLSVIDDKLRLLLNYQDFDKIDSVSSSNNEYIKNINKEIFYKYVYAVTPKGETIILPKNSTALDFAFKIHSKIPYYAYLSRINGKEKPLEYVIKTGDVVEILTSNRIRCGKSYVNKVFINSNKQKINKFLDHLKENQNLINKETAIRYISKFTKENKISDQEWSKLIPLLLKYLNISKISDFYNRLSNKNIKISKVYQDYIDEKNSILSKKKASKSTTKIAYSYDNYHDIIFLNNEDAKIQYNFANCCKPIYNEEIVTYINASNIINIHRSNCSNITFDDEFIDNKRSLVAKWNPNHNNDIFYLTRIYIYSIYNSYSFNKINKILISNSLQIKKVTIKETNNMQNLRILIELYVKSVDQINDLISSLKRIDSVLLIERK